MNNYAVIIREGTGFLLNASGIKTNLERIKTMKTLDKKYASVKEMMAAGFTEEDIKALANGPRSKEAEWDEEHTFFRWPSINGINVTGLFSLLTREEKDAYNAYHKKHGPTGERTFVPSKDKLELIAKCDALAKYIQENLPKNKQADGIALVNAIRPVVKNNIVQELFDVADISQLKTKVTKTWIMYRGPNGERGSNPETFSLKDAFEQWGDDVTCVITKAQLEEKVKKLEDKGIIVKNTIVA